MNRLIIFASWLIPLIPIVSQAENCGHIEQLKGAVEVHRLKSQTEDNRTAIKISKVPFSLDCTDVVVTRVNSAARIRSGATVLALSANTRIAANIKSERSEGNWLDLSFGKIRSFFKGKQEEKKGAAFRLSTPVAVVGVRGTDFFASFNPNDFEMRQATISGEVVVVHKQTKKELSVKSGQQAIARPTEEIKDLDKEIPKPKSLIYSDSENALVVVPMDEVVKMRVRETSELAKKVSEFETKEAIQILGPSDKWVPVDMSQVPEDLKNPENKF